MHRYLIIVLALGLGGCGAEVASTAAVAGAAKAQEAKQAQQTQQQFQQRLDAAMQSSQQQRAEMEKATSQ